MEAPAGIHLIRTPVPYPLKFANCYLCESAAGWILIDAGCSTPDTYEFWKQTLAQYGIAKGQLAKVIVTHFHPDHLGAAGWLQREWGAQVVVHRPDWEWTMTQWGDPDLKQAGFIEELYVRHGCPVDLAGRVRAQMLEQRSHTVPLPQNVVEIAEGESIELAGGQYKVVRVPGHADGMIAFWNEADSIFIAADAILPHITPNVGLWPRCRLNPLHDFIQTLEMIKVMNPALTLPGHGHPMTNTAARAEDTIQHHVERLNKIAEFVAGGVSNAFQVALAYFKLTELTPHQVRFALGETLAHLEYLVADGRLRRSGDEHVLYLPAAVVREG
jgi:glyoxylase-like metal-dependent hydrolase (beta-lactamase superfamily II)